jgi:nitrogen fixation protein NifU and related proteins
LNPLDDLYQDLLLEHKRRPRNYGRLQCAHRGATGHNPLCGDIVSLQLAERDGAVAEIAFEGEGCAICIASASLLTEAVKGRPVVAAKQLSAAMHELLTRTDPPPEEQQAALGKLAALQGVRRFPSRIKCAMLAWRALDQCLDENAPGSVDAEDGSHARVTS